MSDQTPSPGPGWQPNPDGTHTYTGTPQPFGAPEIGGETQETIGTWCVENNGHGDDLAFQVTDVIYATVALAIASGFCLDDVISSVEVSYKRQIAQHHNKRFPVAATLAHVNICAYSMAHRLGNVNLKHEVDKRMAQLRHRKPSGG